ncbi:hypothetical protein [Variovorax guangxiensis]|uniref:hypothetical protein n=1 Tax=Variovorax guangxiensis TaxID=1775474 RepID=UPI00285C4F35|nr:hypothetical protein [Variovorax guangxiensis]MDR6857310.1 putative membrane protein YqiK [Variovorax guangxiensis]
MRNPWVQKNPFLSAWLSAANTMTGAARSYASAEMHRQMAAAQAEMTRQMIDLWSGKAAMPATRRKKKRR